MFDVITIGAATVDIFVKSSDFQLHDDPHSPTGKVLSLPASFKTEISQYLITSGGGATNTAVSFSRLGFQTGCISLLGTDNFGQIVNHELQSDHVSLELLAEKNNEKTDFSVILSDPEGGRTVLVNRGETSLNDSHIPWELLDTSWLYITSLEGNLPLLEKILGFAKENNIKVALNPGSRELMQSSLLKPLLSSVEFLLLNTYEAELLTQKSFGDSTFWQAIESYGSKIIAVTNGRNGAYVVGDGQNYFSPIINHSPVDENGAGDAFGSAFTAALMLSLPLSTCLSWGMHSSASVVSFLGAKAGLLTRAQIKLKTNQ